MKFKTDRPELQATDVKNRCLFYNNSVRLQHFSNQILKNNVFVGKPEGRRPLGRPRRRWVDNIRDGAPGGGMWVYGLDWAGPG